MKRLDPAAAHAAAKSELRLLLMRYGANNLKKIVLLMRRELKNPRPDGVIKGNVETSNKEV